MSSRGFYVNDRRKIKVEGGELKRTEKKMSEKGRGKYDSERVSAISRGYDENGPFRNKVSCFFQISISF